MPCEKHYHSFGLMFKEKFFPVTRPGIIFWIGVARKNMREALEKLKECMYESGMADAGTSPQGRVKK